MLSQKKLKKILDYDPKTGIFTWRHRDGEDRKIKIFNSKYAGKRAGVTCPRGYRYIRIRSERMFSEGRLAWLYVMGEHPKLEIDHINGNPSDNRFENLREATRAQNGANRGTHRNNRSGYKGVYKKKGRNIWVAQAAMGGIRRTRQCKSAKEAHLAYVAMSRELQKEFARP